MCDVLADRVDEKEEAAGVGYTISVGATTACSPMDETLHRRLLSVRDDELENVENTAPIFLDALGVDDLDELVEGVGGRDDEEAVGVEQDPRPAFWKRSFSICSVSFSWCSVIDSLVNCSDWRARNAR